MRGTILTFLTISLHRNKIALSQMVHLLPRAVSLRWFTSYFGKFRRLVRWRFPGNFIRIRRVCGGKYKLCCIYIYIHRVVPDIASIMDLLSVRLKVRSCAPICFETYIHTELQLFSFLSLWVSFSVCCTSTSATKLITKTIRRTASLHFALYTQSSRVQPTGLQSTANSSCVLWDRVVADVTTSGRHRYCHCRQWFPDVDHTHTHTHIYIYIYI